MAALIVNRSAFERLVEPDPHERGRIGVRARVWLRIPISGSSVLHEVESPGIWDIELPAEESFLAEVFQDECDDLAAMLEALGVEVVY